ncbi:MAG: alpha/beta hydrolase [Bryobacteraceae bacterium]
MMLRIVPLTLAALSIVAAQKTELLYPNGAPGALGDADDDKPSITIYLPDKPLGAGVVVCPGGGYQHLAMDHEGKQIAEWLNAHGIAAFVLKYRLGPKYHHPVEMNDALQAMRIVRGRAQEFGIAPNKIGIWGFSAGGHLASTVSTHFDGPATRPDFAILCYPVISMKPPFAHRGSVKFLLGDTPDPALIESLSNESQVTGQTPPTFLFATTDDASVPVENSVQYYLALRRNQVSAEMHLYENGRHGLGLAKADPIVKSWPDRLVDWLRVHNWGR